LEISGRVRRNPNSFKFFEGWLKDPEYQDLVRNLWIPLGTQPTSHDSIHFMDNLRKLKQATISWMHEKKLKEDQELLNIEKMLMDWQVDPGRGFFSKEAREELVQVEL
jgi:hypothetical protein